MLSQAERFRDPALAPLVGIVYVLQAELRTVAQQPEEITRVISAGHYDEEISQSAAEADLRRKGFRVEEGCVFVSNSNSWIDGRLSRTEWPGKWAHTLKCMPGAIAAPNTRRFVNADRCIGVPLTGQTQGHNLGD